MYTFKTTVNYTVYTSVTLCASLCISFRRKYIKQYGNNNVYTLAAVACVRNLLLNLLLKRLPGVRRTTTMCLGPRAPSGSTQQQGPR